MGNGVAKFPETGGETGGLPRLGKLRGAYMHCPKSRVNTAKERLKFGKSSRQLFRLIDKDLNGTLHFSEVKCYVQNAMQKVDNNNEEIVEAEAHDLLVNLGLDALTEISESTFVQQLLQVYDNDHRTTARAVKNAIRTMRRARTRYAIICILPYVRFIQFPPLATVSELEHIVCTLALTHRAGGAKSIKRNASLQKKGRDRWVRVRVRVLLCAVHVP